MSLGCSRFRSVVLVWFASSCLVIHSGYAQGQPQPRRSIELSETNSAEILTNLNLLTNKKEASRQLEDQLRALKNLTSPDSMEERFAIPYSAPAVMPSKRVKELMDRHKNWAMTAEEISLVNGGYGADSLKGIDADKNSSKNSLQQFYEALIQPGANNQTSDRSGNNRPTVSKKKDQDSFDNNRLDDDSSLPPGLREKTQQLKEAVNEDPGSVFNPARARTSFDNFFGLSGTPSPNPEQSPTVKPPGESFLDQYKKGLDPSAALGLNPALSALVPNGGSLRTAVSPDLGKLPAPLHKEQSLVIPTIAGSVPDPTTLSDVNATVLNQWNPLYTPQKLQLPKATVTPPTPIDLEFPRRRF